MADRRGRCGAGSAMLALSAAVLALGGCGSDGNGAAPAGAETEEWIAADVGAVPEGLVLDGVEEYASDGRRIGYRAIDRGPYGDDGRQVQITARVPMGWSLDELIAAFEAAPSDRKGEVDVDAEVSGHRAIVYPASSDGQEFGWEVIWEPAPGVQVQLTDSRHDTHIRQTATREGALALAETVHPVDRATWDPLLAASLAASPYASPGPAIERPVASGDLDGQTWTLTSIEAPTTIAVPPSCYRLAYAGADTGTNCAPERVVLGGKGFAILWVLGEGGRAPELEPGPRSSFEPVRPTVYPIGGEPERYVALAVLPDGACGVEYARPFSESFETKNPLNLLPGDPGAVECSTR